MKSQPVLLTVGAAQPDAGDLGDRVGVVGRFERAAEKVFLADRLRTVTRIDARAPEVEQPPHVRRPARFDDRGVNHQVVVDELRRARAVGEDTADRAGHEEDVLGAVRLEPCVHCRLIAKIHLLPRGAQDAGEALRLRAAAPAPIRPARDVPRRKPPHSDRLRVRAPRDCINRPGGAATNRRAAARDSSALSTDVPADSTSGNSSTHSRLSLHAALFRRTTALTFRLGETLAAFLLLFLL